MAAGRVDVDGVRGKYGAAAEYAVPVDDEF
jgi:hypothetical protein